MRSVSVSELKAKLSEYLARVKGGQEVIVTERRKPIAKIVPLRREAESAAVQLRELQRAGLVRVGAGDIPPNLWDLPRPKDPAGRGVSALLEERMAGR